MSKPQEFQGGIVSHTEVLLDVSEYAPLDELVIKPQQVMVNSFSSLDIMPSIKLHEVENIGKNNHFKKKICALLKMTWMR